MLAYEQIIGFIVGIESVVGMQLPTFPTLTTACATTSTALGDFPSIEVRVSPALPHARTRPSHILTSFLLALRYPALRVRYFLTKLKSDALARALRRVTPPAPQIISCRTTQHATAALTPIFHHALLAHLATCR